LSSQQVKILLDENGNVVLVRVSGVVNTSTDDKDAVDDEDAEDDDDE